MAELPPGTAAATAAATPHQPPAPQTAAPSPAIAAAPRGAASDKRVAVPSREVDDEIGLLLILAEAA